MSYGFSNLFTIPENSYLLHGEFNVSLVALSIFLAVLSSFMALQVASQASATRSTSRKHISLVVGSIALGGGIWSMHFIGMLAFHLHTPVNYDIQITLISLLPGICASWVALNYIMNHRQNRITLIIGGFLVGAGIGTMHYTGMAAMEMAVELRYDFKIFLLSIFVAVILAIVSLWIRFGLIQLKSYLLQTWQINLISSLVMGLAISGMHYTGMAGARFIMPDNIELVQNNDVSAFYLALAVTVATLIVIFLVLGLTLIFKYKDISSRAVYGEQRVRAVMDTAIDAIIIIDSKGRILDANRATGGILGWPPEELVGQNVNVLMSQPYHSEHDAYLSNFLTTNVAKIIGKGREVRAKHKNGSELDVRLAIGHLKMSNADFFVGFISDISQRITMERAVRDSEIKFRSLIGNIPGIAYRCNVSPPWSMLFISDAVKRVTGYDQNEFLPPDGEKTFFDLIHPEDLQHVINSSSDAHEFRVEYRILHKNGTVRWMMEYGRKVTLQESDFQVLDGFITDITHRKKMEEQLVEAKIKAEAAAETRAAFMANMSHEIRTPMNAIIGFSDILVDSDLTNESLRHLEIINRSAKSLLHLLNDILDSAKLDNKKLELEMRHFSLIEEVDTVLSTLWIQARKKGLEIRSELSINLAETYCGAQDRLRQVLTNLIGNAIKFTDHGEIIVKVQTLSNNDVHFSIKDTGIGMSKDQVEKVFEPFTQAEASMTRRYGGTGLGTTISKQLIELMGGSITVSSVLGKGTEFVFTLPIERTESAAGEQAIETKSLPPLTILLVDDIQQNIELLSIMLVRDGHKILTARDGQQALVRMASAEPIDIVLMDIQMPEMDGLTAAAKHRDYEKSQGTDELPIIALTASVLEEDRQAAINAGMNGFAHKPVNKIELYEEIARVLRVEMEREPIKENHSLSSLAVDFKYGKELWGSTYLHLEQVKKFLKPYEDELVQINKSYLGKDWQRISTFAHTNRGLAGNLALNQMRDTLSHLEALAKCKSIQCSQVLDDMGQHMKDIRSAMAIGETIATEGFDLDNGDNTSSSLDAKDLAQLLNLTKQLNITIEKNESGDELLNDISQSCNGHFQMQLSPIQAALEDFDFAKASVLINEFIEKLSQRLKEELS